MKKRTVFLFLLSFFCLTLQAQTQFTVEAPNVVAVGERFRVIFTADAKQESFKEPTIDEGFILLAGPTTSTMNRVEIVNGHRTQSRTVSYTYILEARKEGRFTIGEASIVSEGVTYKTKPVTIEVVAGSQSQANSSQQQEAQTLTDGSVSGNDIFLRLSVSKQRVVKGESLTATLKLYTRVNLSGVEDVQFPTFTGFWSQEVFAPQQLDFQRENVNGEIYQAAVLRRYVLLPQQTGAVAIDPAEIVCLIQIRNAARGNSLLDDFFDSYQTVRKRVVAPKVTIQVAELPAGAPASFNGAVGKFSLSTRMGKDSVQAHDAVSLFVTITGEGNINLLETPKVKFPPDFETYDPKVKDNSKNSGGAYAGSKEFEYPVIPRSHGDFSIPQVEFSYYDIASKQYKTLRSAPLTLKVTKNTDASFASGAPATQGMLKRSVQSLGNDVRYIVTAPQSWRKKDTFFVGSFVFFGLVVLLGGVFAGMYVWMNKRRERRKDVVRVRNSRANKIARTRLKTAESLLKQQLFAGFYEELHRALWGYIADKLALSQADCSRDNVAEILAAKQMEKALVDEFMAIIEACEFARYAPDPGQVEKERIFDRAVAVISQLEQRLK